MNNESVDGILLIDKPIGWTSFDAVAKVRGILKAGGMKKPKVGHTGTLDPLASGLLVLVLGSYCKKADEYTKLDKVYEVEMTLGFTTETGDLEGQKTNVSDKKPSQQEIEEALRKFVGEIEQIPPKYSAIKIDGQRAYKLARAGKEVEMKPRKVIVNKLDEISYKYPKVYFTASVSSGTYIRSLVEDIGKILKVGGTMSNLKRNSVGNFDLDNSHKIEILSSEFIAKNILVINE